MRALWLQGAAAAPCWVQHEAPSFPFVVVSVVLLPVLWVLSLRELKLREVAKLSFLAGSPQSQSRYLSARLSLAMVEVAVRDAVVVAVVVVEVEAVGGVGMAVSLLLVCHVVLLLPYCCRCCCWVSLRELASGEIPA